MKNDEDVPFVFEKYLCVNLSLSIKEVDALFSVIDIRMSFEKVHSPIWHHQSHDRGACLGSTQFNSRLFAKGFVRHMLNRQRFVFAPGDKILDKYCVIGRLGGGYEGEVYKVKERTTGIPLIAKLFFPHRNHRNKTSRFYARKLYKLRPCSVLIHYHSVEKVIVNDASVTMLIAEYVEGLILSRFLEQFEDDCMSPFQAMHLFYALVKGIEEIHGLNEYHGDLHVDNVMVTHFGLSFRVKLFDFFHWGASNKANRDKDLSDLIRIFYDCMGGKAMYPYLPKEIKYICCGLKKSLIQKRFRNARQLRHYLEQLEWSAEIW